MSYSETYINRSWSSPFWTFGFPFPFTFWCLNQISYSIFNFYFWFFLRKGTKEQTHRSTNTRDTPFHSIKLIKKNGQSRVQHFYQDIFPLPQSSYLQDKIEKQQVLQEKTSRNFRVKRSDRPYHELMSTVPKYDTEKLLTIHTNWRPLKIMIPTIQCHKRTTTIRSKKSSHPPKTPVMKKKINIYPKIELPGDSHHPVPQKNKYHTK